MRASGWLRWATLAAHASLIGGLGWITKSALGLLLILPLLVPLPGLWRGRRYTYAWASMLLVFYCAGLLAEAYMRPTHAWLLRGLAGVAALEFLSLVLFVRLRSAEGKL